MLFRKERGSIPRISIFFHCYLPSMFFPPCYMLQLLDSIITTCFGPTKGNSTINVFPPCYMLQFLDIIVGLKKKN